MATFRTENVAGSSLRAAQTKPDYGMHLAVLIGAGRAMVHTDATMSTRDSLTTRARITAGGAVSDDQVALALRAVADPVRLELLRFLLDDEHCVTQCMGHTGLQQSLVSKHLARLVDTGLVVRRRAGRRNYHRVRDPQAVRALLAVVPRLLPSPTA
jgi:DNA-binding transcriptional ArsR family regulator